MPETITLNLRFAIAPALMGFAVFMSNRSSVSDPNVLPYLAGAAAAVQMFAMMLRDAEFRALCAGPGLALRDLVARFFLVSFDGLFLFALITAPGLRLPQSSYLLYSLVIIVVLLIATFLSGARSLRHRPTVPLPWTHLVAPLPLLALIFAFFGLGGLQVDAGSQPYIFVLVLSGVVAPMRPDTPMDRPARAARQGMLVGIAVLMIANYMLAS